jgi:hypothetical protein
VALVLATTTPGEAELFASLQKAHRSGALRSSCACRGATLPAAGATAYTWRFSGDNRPHRDDIAFERTANQVTADEDDIAARILAFGVPRLVVTGRTPVAGPCPARMIARSVRA